MRAVIHKRNKQENKLDNTKGIYFNKKDYAGFWLRLGSWLVDSVVIVLFVSLVWFLVYNTIDDPFIMLRVTFFSSLLFMYFYLAIVKASRFGTVGYKIFSIKVVDLFGKKPNWHTMLLRFFLIFIGPFTFITDILWLTGESSKQTLRDKYAGTYVVKSNATPEGDGTLNNVSLHFMGWNLSLKEIEIKK